MGVLDSTFKKLATALGSSGDAQAILSQLHTPVLESGATITDSSLTIDTGAAAAALSLSFGSGEGTRVYVIDEVVTLTNAVSTALTNTVPAGAVILSVQGNLQTAVVGDASGDDLFAKVGIGVAADPDKYGLSAVLTANAKLGAIPDWAVLGTAETVIVKAAKTDGSAATEKFVAGGQVRVRIVYLALTNLADA